MRRASCCWQALAACCLGSAWCASAAQAQQPSNPHWLDLPTSKQLMLPAPGNPQRVNSLPMSLAVSPDRRWIVSLNAGYGTFESGYMQSLAVLDAHTGKVRDFPEPRTLLDTSQAFFAGVAFSSDGTRVYASLASSTDLQGDGQRKTGNGIAVYTFSQGELKPEKFFSLPAVALAPGRRSSLLSSDGHTVSPYPAAIAIVPGARDALLVAENLADSVALMDAQTGLIVHSFDLSVSENVPATYPIAVAATQDGTRAYVALWNASEVVELNLTNGSVNRRLSLMKPAAAAAPGSHPCALLLDERAGLLYVALSNRDAVAAISISEKRGRKIANSRFEVISTRAYRDRATLAPNPVRLHRMTTARGCMRQIWDQTRWRFSTRAGLGRHMLPAWWNRSGSCRPS